MILEDYLKNIGLQNATITSHGEINNAFLKAQIFNLYDAIAFIKKLTYGRTTDREKYLQVLNEKRGACSTKHALLAALADELSIPLKLMLGIVLITEKNSPNAAAILTHYQIEAIPEAHCYLKYDNDTLDITFPESSEFTLNYNLEREIYITPQQIGLFKVTKHQEFIKTWVKDKPHLNFNLIWAAREHWIRELSPTEK